ncbi:MAG: hypothetical protein GPJ01_02920 [Microcystis aeruginosa LL13-06]|jgi:hypothetical protein|nr:hypothetical protein [Microcystis aeruginosa SX13-11]NCR56802.1 hypothetical protein [Microcystis aeruginosa LL13-06]NCR88566.1 hypothetical protein [Microcystis aeruginosa G13-10]NCS19270.1 hypothetical protein [Microcystis aeruginosa G11-06]NCS37165.1 hypothetical protein [Microcystis aeruginosa G11-01]
MKATTLSQTESPNLLSRQEICQFYPEQWVLILNPELDEELNVIQGQVLTHSANRDEVYNQLSLRQGQPVAIEYTGIIPDNIVVVI